ncbi:MAG: hypothetical protein ACREMF_02710 [Gemmatimonadales bacterium]
MRVCTLIAIASLTATLGSPAFGQSAGAGQTGPRPHLPREREIALARSAAPATLADSATIWVLSGGQYEIAVRGTTGAACYVSRSWIESVEPHCYDAEGAATILPMAMRQIELLIQGRTPAEADREIAERLAAGRYRLPRRPAVSYMMSSGQELVADDGRRVGNWQPHLMIYFPFLTGADLGLGKEGDLSAAVVVDPGTPRSNLMIVVRKFVDPVVPAPR